MSELQIALVAAALALVAAIWLYNLWQEKKQRRRSKAMFPPSVPDPLMADRSPSPPSPPSPPQAPLHPIDRAEPALTPLATPQPAVPAAGHFIPPAPTDAPWADADETPPTQYAAAPYRAPDSYAPPPAARPAPPPPPPAVPEPAPLAPIPDEWGDGRADCLLRLEFDAPVPVKALLDRPPEWTAAIDKPIQWLGLEAKTGRWRTLFPQEPGAVQHLAVALQLIDRRGAVDAETVKLFADEIVRLAEQFHGRIDGPKVDRLLERALHLDAFCASVDLQLSVHVLPRATTRLSQAKLLPLIEEAGLRLEGERYVALAADDAEAFSLTLRTGASAAGAGNPPLDPIDLLFGFDVPRVAAGPEAFDRMIAFAQQCALAVGGLLADAHRKPLPDATVAKLRARIDEMQQRMIEQGIPPGSVRALRLFS